MVSLAREDDLKGCMTSKTPSLFQEGIRFQDGTLQTTAAISGSPGGSPTQVQYNLAGAFAGVAGSSVTAAGALALAPTGTGVALSVTGTGSVPDGDVGGIFANVIGNSVAGQGSMVGLEAGMSIETSCTDVIGVRASTGGGVGNATLVSGIYVKQPQPVTGTWTHVYGMYVEDQTVGGILLNPDPWAVFSPSNSRFHFGPLDTQLSNYGLSPSVDSVYRIASKNQSKAFNFAIVTSVSITSNVLSITATNTFTVGQQVQFSGMTSATFLNGAVVVIATITGGGSGFTALFTHANYGPTAEGAAYCLNAVFSTALSIDSEEDQSASQNFSTAAFDGLMACTTATDTLIPAGSSPVVWPSSGIVGVNATGDHEGAGYIQGTTPVQTVQVTSNILTIVPQSGNRFSPWIIGTAVTFQGFTTATFLNPAPITSTTVTANVVTITASNSFQAGQLVRLRGLTTSTFLNWVTLTVSATGLSGSSFQAAFTHANYGATADTGSAQPIATVLTSSASGGGSAPFTASLGTVTNLGLTTDTTGEIIGGTFYTAAGTITTSAVDVSTGGTDMVCGQVIDTGLQGHTNNVCGTFYSQMSDQGGYTDNQYAIYIQDQTQLARNRSGNVWAVYVQGGTSRFTGIATNIQTVTSTYTATVNDYTILCNGTFTVTLPILGTLLSGANPQGVKIGQIFVIKNIGTGTITVSSAANIDGTTTQTIGAQYASITVQWDGTQYWIQ